MIFLTFVESVFAAFAILQHFHGSLYFPCIREVNNYTEADTVLSFYLFSAFLYH